MKRLFALCLLALMACSIQAQQRWWLGGSVSANTQTESGKGSKASIDHLSLSPAIGLDLNDRWTVVTALEYQYTGLDHSNNSSKSTLQTLGISPIVYYTFAEVKDFCFYVEASGTWSTNFTDKDDHDYYNVGFGLRPGVSYTIGNRVALFTDFGGLDWQKEWYSDSGSHTSFSLGLWSTFSLGFYVYL